MPKFNKKRILFLRRVLVQSRDTSGNKSDRSSNTGSIHILHCNIRGFRTNRLELSGYVHCLDNPPDIILLNETFLDDSVGKPAIPGYTNFARRDRGSEGGGVMGFALDRIASSVCFLETSSDAERFWFLLHTTAGPYLICCWYRPPAIGETASISTLRSEFDKQRALGIGCLILG